MRPKTEHDLLQDIEKDVLQRDANTGLRLANYVIDLFSFYALIIVAVLLVALTARGTSLFRAIENMSDTTDFILIHVLYGFYMLVVEGLFKGKTLGKYITRTRVVRRHSAAFSWNDALKRGCMRMIPLEYVTGCVGVPFHDDWTQTRVVMEHSQVRKNP